MREYLFLFVEYIVLEGNFLVENYEIFMCLWKIVDVE